MIREVFFQIIGGQRYGINSSVSHQRAYISETKTPEESIYNDNKNVTLQIKEEQLDIAKKWIQTEDVKIYREILIEEKSFTVPIKREELVIEKKSLTSDTLEPKDNRSYPYTT